QITGNSQWTAGMPGMRVMGLIGKVLGLVAINTILRSNSTQEATRPNPCLMQPVKPPRKFKWRLMIVSPGVHLYLKCVQSCPLVIKGRCLQMLHSKLPQGNNVLNPLLELFCLTDNLC